MDKGHKGIDNKENNHKENTDHKLWDRLVWQEAIDKAIRNNQKKMLKSKQNHRP